MIKQLKYNRLLILYNKVFFENGMILLKSGSIVHRTTNCHTWLVDVVGGSSVFIYKNKFLTISELEKIPIDFIIEQLVKLYVGYKITIY